MSEIAAIPLFINIFKTIIFLLSLVKADVLSDILINIVFKNIFETYRAVFRTTGGDVNQRINFQRPYQ